MYMQLRTAKLGSVPLTSLVLLEETKTPLSGQAHVLAGSYDNRVCPKHAIWIAVLIPELAWQYCI